jgi:hypothetical protein
VKSSELYFETLLFDNKPPGCNQDKHLWQF